MISITPTKLPNGDNLNAQESDEADSNSRRLWFGGRNTCKSCRKIAAGGHQRPDRDDDHHDDDHDHHVDGDDVLRMDLKPVSFCK